MDYKATIHTLEIAVDTKDLEPSFLGCTKEKDYIRKVYPSGANQYSLVINPHKFNGKNADGKYHFEYHSLQQHNEIMQNIANDLNFEEYSIKRLDVCLDTFLDYEYTEKLIRYIVLMLAGEIGANNRYLSIDPLTQEVKTIRASKKIGYNGTTHNGELQIEHYDRSKLDQRNWDTLIMNRLELRSMGTEAGEKHSAEDIISAWKWRLQLVLESATALQVENEVNQGLWEKWEHKFQNRLIDTSEKPVKRLKSRFNAFLLNNLDQIFTRRQLIDMYCRFGESTQTAKHSADNLRSQNRRMFFGQMFSPSMVEDEVISLCRAIEKFTGENS